MLSRFYCTYRAFGSASWVPLLILSALSACGGGGSSDNRISRASSVAISVSSGSSVVSSLPADNEPVIVSGKVTYDRVPHNQNHIGLDHNATVKMPVRGAVVELLNASGSVIAATSTDNEGGYALSAAKNTQVKVRVKAAVLQTASPTWDFKVTDNTANNATYALTGSFAITGIANSQRNLHAASGWNGFQYTATRAAAPFAILDTIYNAATRLTEAGNLADLAPLELRWSTKNKTAEGNVTLGEVGTSYFDREDGAIYILGDANNDADEYDSHVVAHEWGHYLEQSLFRGDSPGGNHTQGDVLDMRVSMSEGFANAFAAITLDNPYYADSFGNRGSDGFFIDIGNRESSVQGFYSEASIGSIFYNYYLSANNKASRDFAPILRVLSDSSYIANDAVTSIFLFYARLQALLADQVAEFTALLQEQEIYGTNEYAENETNDAGYAEGLPLYKTLQVGAGAINVCSSAAFGKYNKYANSQLLALTVSEAKSYFFSMVQSGGAPVTSRPEMFIFRRGEIIEWFGSTTANQTSGAVQLAPGTYIVEAYDKNNRTESNTQRNTTCFDIQVVPN